MFKRDQFTIKDIARGFGSIGYKIEGYWSTPVEVFYERSFTGKWKFSISNSSGGHEEGVSVIDRARNLAAALEDAAETVEYLQSVEDQLEAGYMEWEQQMDALVL